MTENSAIADLRELRQRANESVAESERRMAQLGWVRASKRRDWMGIAFVAGAFGWMIFAAALFVRVVGWVWGVR